MTDDLTRPLGLKPGRKTRGKQFYALAAGGLAVVVIGAGLVTWMLVPPAKGPTAVAVIATPPAGTATIAPDRTGSTVAAPAQGLTEMEPTGGLSDVGGKVIIHNPSEEAPIQLASLPEADLVEQSDKGPLPRVSKSGTRPIDAYARPSQTNSGDTRVAIIVGGLGLDPAGTRQAIETLPGTITLAFAPYGDDLAASTAAARVAGHELLLQVPLEPFNYPKTDPGPNTLTANASEAENRGRLHWLMARFTNYVGVVNYMGARFTSEADALTPVLQELGQRGLLYLDDGSSARSKAAEIAGTATPFLRADLVLDADLTAESIDASLKQLQAIARERGYAIATATAFPISIERVAAFAKAAANKGITLVPVTALLPGRS